MRRVTVGEVLELQRRPVQIDPTAEYALIGVYSFGKGIFHRDPQLGVDLGNYKFSAVRPGDLVMSNIQAWEGAIGHATDADVGTIGTHRFLSYTARDPKKIDTNWARYYFLSSAGFPSIQKAAPGSVTRNRTLAQERFESIEMPLPDIDEQRQLATHLDRVAALAYRVSIQQEKRDPLLAGLRKSAFQQEFAKYVSPEPIASAASVDRGASPRYLPDSDAVCINQGCVQWAGMTLARARSVDPLWAEEVPVAKRIGVSDVLVNSTGEGTIGRACLAGDAVGLPYDSHVLAVRPDVDRLRPAFLNLFLRSPQGQAAIEDVKGANTTKQTELGKRKLEAILVPIPDIARQDESVHRLSRFLQRSDRAVALGEASSKVRAGLLQSALNRAFDGLA